ncbi:uncharacterized protein KY384_008784 [Bacidia gigantensis]|uniref:uncharacterized protein n=1 Tax=Bacidia gigantensis TaxID=2732470 RepID=UPI001D0473FB|nr:uncharacterized protein KY384_008784 [Bacidia gigantensis]KAG8526583.1 hypothetical protein KY384_008784 [Bacidia gigantensis]
MERGNDPFEILWERFTGIDGQDAEDIRNEKGESRDNPARRPLDNDTELGSGLYQRFGAAFPPESTRINESKRIGSSTEIVDLTGDSESEKQGGIADEAFLIFLQHT